MAPALKWVFPYSFFFFPLLLNHPSLWLPHPRKLSVTCFWDSSFSAEIFQHRSLWMHMSLDSASLFQTSLPKSSYISSSGHFNWFHNYLQLRQMDLIIMLLIFLFLRGVQNSPSHKGGKLCNQPWWPLLFSFCNRDDIWDGEDVKLIFLSLAIPNS